MGEYQQLGGKLDVKTAATAVITGLLWGFALVKGMAFVPSVIVKQFALWPENWTLLKVSLAAIVSSLIVQSLMSIISKEKYSASRGQSNHGLIAVIVGSGIVGMGMAGSGSTPAIAYAQMGSAIQNAVFTWIGGMVAVPVYGLLYDVMFRDLENVGNPEKQYLDDAMNAEYWHIALPAAGGIGTGLFFLEHFRAWTKDIPSGAPAPEDGWRAWLPLIEPMWSPYLCGMIIGLCQVPLGLAIQQRLSSTLSYVSIISVPLTALGNTVEINVPGWFKAHGNSMCLWNLILCLCVGGGGSIAAGISNVFQIEKGLPITWSLGGGFLMVLGSLMAGGCHAAHGISGVSDLRMGSVLAAGAMYGGAILGVFLMKKLDINPQNSGNDDSSWSWS